MKRMDSFGDKKQNRGRISRQGPTVVLKGPNLFQEGLLRRTGIEWSVRPGTGEVVMDIDMLSTEDFVELLGAGVFTYHREPEGSDNYVKHNLMFEVALRHGHRFVHDKDLVSRTGLITKRTIVLQREIEGLQVLVHPIVDKNGVDSGMCKIVWGDA